MRIHIYLFLLIVTFQCRMFGQAPFTRYYGSLPNQEGGSIIQTVEGDFVIYSSFWKSPAVSSALTRIHPNGDTVWSKPFDFCNNNPYDRSLIQDIDSGFIFTGETANNQCIVVKVNKSGDTLWTCKPGKGNLVSVILTHDRNIVAAGSDSGAKIVKLGRDGSVIWMKSYLHQPHKIASIVAKGIRETSNGSFFISGYTGGLDWFGSVFTLRLTASGDSISYRNFIGIGDFTNTCIVSMDTTGDQNYILAGYCTGTNVIYRGLLMKVNEQGDTLWSRLSGDSTFYMSVVTMRNGHFATCGGFRDTILYNPSTGRVFYAEFNSEGKRLRTWRNYRYDLSSPKCIIQSNDGGFVMSGSTDNYGENDSLYVIKTDPQGWMEGVDEKTSSGKASVLECYPNPCKDNLTVRHLLQGTKSAVLDILDVTGRSVRREDLKNPAGTLTLDLEDIPDGLFTITLFSGSGVQSGRFIHIH
jgi:hypothetical protein